MVVYLDHAATTPMLASARAAYLAALDTIGNPSSIHSNGQTAKLLLENSRSALARALGCDPIEVVLTSGGTEAVNLALKGLYWSRFDASRRRVLVAAGEHHATIDAVEWLASHEGALVEWVPLTADGTIDLSALAEMLEAGAEEIALVSMLWANNEVGTIQPVAELARLTAVAGVPLHLDAISAFGHVPLDFSAIRASSGASGEAGLVAMSVSAHKIGGPVSSGALVLSRQTTVVALQHGGGQQRGVRSGTQDVAGVAAFAAAAREATEDLVSESRRLAALRDALVEGVLAQVEGARLNGPPVDSGRRLPGNAHISFPGAQGDSLLFLLDTADVSVSTGSACTAGIPEPSHVLIAMGRSEDEARSVLRLTLGRASSRRDVEALVAVIGDVYRRASRAGLSSRPVRVSPRS